MEYLRTDLIGQYTYEHCREDRPLASTLQRLSKTTDHFRQYSAHVRDVRSTAVRSRPLRTDRKINSIQCVLFHLANDIHVVVGFAKTVSPLPYPTPAPQPIVT